MGLIILSGLPNSTSIQQEMDALYGPFKSATYDRGEHVLMEKMKVRGTRREAATPRAGILLLSFDDLSTIVNERDDDDLSMKLFDKNFTKGKILRAWARLDLFHSRGTV